MARKKSASDIYSQYTRIFDLANGQGERLQKAGQIAKRYADNARKDAIKRGHYPYSAHLVPASQRVYMGLANG